MSNKPQPWERQRDADGELEPMLWFGRFDAIYRPMGTERSLLGAVNSHRANRSEKRTISIPGAWTKAFERWDWKNRAEAWDQYERDRLNNLFQERTDAWRTNRFEDAETLRGKALELLRLPVIKRRGVDDKGEPYVIEAVPPTTLRAAAAILKTADELARITTRETLPTTEIDHTTGGKPINPNVIVVREYVDESESD